MKIEPSKKIFIKKEGDVVLEDSVLLSFFYLTEDFDPLTNFKTISEISRLIESVVFYERLFIFDYEIDKENTEVYYFAKNPLLLADIINKLTKEKVINFVQLLPFNLAPQPSILLKQVKQSKIIPSKKLNSFSDVWFPYYLYQQEIARKTNCPFISSDNEYVEYFIIGSQKFKFSLANKLIQSINQNVNRQFTDILKTYHNIEMVIPPLFSMVLNNVINGATFGDAILDVRNQFKGIRKLFSEYHNLFYDRTKPLNKQIKTAYKIFSDIEKIARKFSIVEKTKYKIWSDSFDFIIGSVANIKDFNVLSNADLLSRLAKLSKDMVYELFLRYRYNSIYKLRKDFYQLKEYSSILIKAIEPSIKESKKVFEKTKGYICISPGNPFRDVPGFEKD